MHLGKQNLMRFEEYSQGKVAGENSVERFLEIT